MSDSSDLRPNTPPAPAEDASTQALSEALESGFFLVKIAMAALVLYFCCSNFFSVSQNEQAVILRFGKPGELLGPGLHAAWPYPIDEVRKMPAARILSAGSTVGWYYVDPRALAGDKNPPPPALNPAVDDALRRNLAGLTEKVQARVEALAREQDLGISVQQVDLVTAAPRQVKAAFDEVTAAENELSSRVNEAQGYANEILAKARGEAVAITNAAETARTRLLNEIEGEARYFADLLPSYERNPALFLRRWQVETVARVMTNAQDKFFIPARADGRARELRLQLNREPQKPKAAIEAPKSGHDH